MTDPDAPYRDDQPTRQFRMPSEPPHAAPWQGPPPDRWNAAPRYDRSMITIVGMLLLAIVVICGITAWFIAELVPN